jgi:hypothetical protein
MTSGSAPEPGTRSGGKKSSKQQSFIQKLFKMATCLDHAQVFGFSGDGTHLEIRNPATLGPVLIRYFKHSNTSSFIRQLNNYGFKTISSVSTGKSIQCFAHPHFHRDAKDVVDTITRKTAKSLKKCKRDIIRELQTAETEYRKRLRDLEQRTQRLEQHNGVLERENKRLMLDIKRFEGGAVTDRVQSGSVITTSRRSSLEPAASSMDGGAEPTLEMNSDYSEDSPLFYKTAQSSAAMILPMAPNNAYVSQGFGSPLPHAPKDELDDDDEDDDGFSSSSSASAMYQHHPTKRLALESHRSSREESEQDDVDILDSLAEIEHDAVVGESSSSTM